MGNAYIFSLQPTFTQGLILGQFSILFLLVLVLKYLFFDTVSDHAYRTSSYQPKIERDEDEDGIALVAERLAPKPAQDGKQSGNECESADWLNALLIQVCKCIPILSVYAESCPGVGSIPCQAARRTAWRGRRRGCTKASGKICEPDATSRISGASWLST